MTGTNQGIAAGLVVLLASCGGWGGVSSSELDLAIDAAFVTQGTQDPNGGVPLVRGRDGWVRVLVTANQPNNAWPDVRVTFFEGGAPVKTLTIPAPSLVPFEADQGSMARTWNVRAARRRGAARGPHPFPGPRPGPRPKGMNRGHGAAARPACLPQPLFHGRSCPARILPLPV